MGLNSPGLYVRTDTYMCSLRVKVAYLGMYTNVY